MTITHNITLIGLLYFFYLIRYIFFADSYLDLLSIVATLFTALMVTANVCAHKFTERILKKIQHICYILLGIMEFTTVLYFLQFIYNIIFYFGFINTLIISSITFALHADNVFTHAVAVCDAWFKKYSFYNKLITIINYTYNAYILPRNILNRSIIIAKHIIKTKILPLCAILYNNVKRLHLELLQNDDSLKLKNQLFTCFYRMINKPIDYYAEAKMKEFHNTINNTFSENFYKDNVTTSSNSTKMVEKRANKIIMEDLDELEELDLDVDMPQAVIPTPAPTPIDKAEQRKLIKKKIEEKKRERLGGNIGGTGGTGARPSASASPSPFGGFGGMGMGGSMPSHGDFMDAANSPEFNKLMSQFMGNSPDAQSSMKEVMNNLMKDPSLFQSLIEKAQE